MMSIGKKYIVFYILTFGSIAMLSSCNPKDNSTVEEVPGCMDSTAFNFNPDATVDDGSCEPVVYGCICECSENYDSIANTDNSLCISDRDKFFGTYHIFSECINQPNFNDTTITNFTVIISADTSDCCKIIRTENSNGSTTFYSVSGDSIIMPHYYHIDPHYPDYPYSGGGTAVLQNDTIFVYTYNKVSGAVINYCNQIWVKQ